MLVLFAACRADTVTLEHQWQRDGAFDGAAFTSDDAVAIGSAGLTGIVASRDARTEREVDVLVAQVDVVHDADDAIVLVGGELSLDRIDVELEGTDVGVIDVAGVRAARLADSRTVALHDDPSGCAVTWFDGGLRSTWILPGCPERPAVQFDVDVAGGRAFVAAEHVVYIFGDEGIDGVSLVADAIDWDPATSTLYSLDADGATLTATGASSWTVELGGTPTALAADGGHVLVSRADDALGVLELFDDDGGLVRSTETPGTATRMWIEATSERLLLEIGVPASPPELHALRIDLP